MKLLANEIRFECPRCHRPMVGDKMLQAEFVDCPECQQNFKPEPQLNAPSTAKPASYYSQSKSSPKSIPKRSTRDKAKIFSFAAALSLVIAIVTAVGATLVAIDDAPSLLGWICAGSFISLASWLYLIAQVIHIRANTEK